MPLYPGPALYPSPEVYPAGADAPPTPATPPGQGAGLGSQPLGTSPLGTGLRGTGLPVDGWSPPPGHEWLAFSRAANYGRDLVLPIVSASVVKKHLGVSKAVLVTDYTTARWDSLQEGRGLVIYRDGVREFTGRTHAPEAGWDKESGRKTIKVEAVGEESRLAGRIVFPDPLRAADDQTVNDYWMTRSGTTPVAKAASTAMYQLISDQAGSGAHVSRRIPGLALGADPAVGLSRIWQGLFVPVLDLLATMGVASGQNLGLRADAGNGVITYTVVQPRDLASSVVFSADLGNLVGFTYRKQAPEVTHALAAGQGDLHLRLRKLVATTDPFALGWGDQFWSYVDRRDTASTTELTDAASDALAEGGPTVSLTVSLKDSPAATYGVDYDVGDIVTVYVGPPDEAKIATVVDVIREITLEVDDAGVETITPAIGTFDAQSLFPSPQQRRLSETQRAVQRLIANK